jgi:outer membrane protein assembly factor BamB
MLTAEPFAAPAVVPIFVNAGAALLPTLVASVTSVAAVLFKPREWAGLVRRKPWLPVAVLAIGAGLWFAIAHLASTPAVAAARNSGERAGGAVRKDDWTAIALKLLQDEENAGKTTGVKPSWSYLPEDPNVTQWVLSTPAYADKSNRVICTATAQDVATYYGLLYAVDADTGKRVWQVEKAGDNDLKPFFSSPALSADQKSVVVGQGLHDDADCSLLCFNAETGEFRWKIATPLHIESSPAIHGDLAVVGAGAIEGEDHKPKTHPGFVLAVRISDGKELWRHDVADPESSPAIDDDGTVYIGSGFNGNAVVALRSESGDELKSRNLNREAWKTSAPYPMTSPVTIAGELVICGGGNCDFVYADPKPAGVVMALDRKTGAVKWQTPMDDAVLNHIAVRDGKVFCPVRNGQVAALNLADGKPIWSQPISGRSPVLSGVTLSADGKTLFAASKDGYLALLDPASGKLIDERHPLNRKDKPGERGLTFSTPIAIKDKVFIGSETGGLHCFQSAAATNK